MALAAPEGSGEKAKIELSTTMETDINLPFITADQSGPKHLQMKLTRAKFEQLVDDLLQRRWAGDASRRSRTRVEPEEIDEVVLVGGSTRIPKVQQMVKEFFGKEPHKGVNPDEVVAIGAAVQGGVLSPASQGRAAARRDAAVARHRDAGRRDDVLIPRNTTIPTKKSEIFSTAPTTRRRVEVHVLQGERPMARDNRRSAFQLVGHSAGAARRAAGRGDLRHRRQRHPQRDREGQGHGQGAEDHHHSNLQSASHKLAEALYQGGSSSGAESGGDEQANAAGASSAGSTGGGTSSTGSDDNVIDAEYVDVDENK
jgi:hypothetical protein